jgi:putative restriction endonuclease
MDLKEFLEIIRHMEPIPGREFKPHRYCALMAILDIIENQENPPNKFYYNDTYVNHFTEHFHNYHGPNDRYNPYKPFFHLKNVGRDVDEFWILSPMPEMEADLNMLVTVSGPGELKRIVEYAELREDIFNLLKKQESREIVRKEIEECLRTGLKT